MLPVIQKERLYLPAQHIKVKQLESEFTKTLYNDRSKCRDCDYVMESPCDMCQECANFGGTFVLYKHVVIDGDDYVGVPIGSRRKVIKLWPQLKGCEKIDQRPAPALKWRRDFEMTWDMYDYQEDAVTELARIGYGILDSPPRSGKTVMGVGLVIRLGLRVLILASQRDWLEQFLETFYEGTNIRDIEKMRGKRLIGIADKDVDFKNLDICLATYQSFISDNGKARFNLVRDSFGVLMIDEVHQVGATEFSKVANNMNCRHKFGLTGTPDRKDGKFQVLPEHILGPVTHKVEVESLTPMVRFTESEFSKTYKTWTPYIRALSVDDDRNQLILDLVMWYLEQGHSIVIPVYHVDHVDRLVDAINEEFGDTIAASFTGRLKKDKRRETLLDARSGKIRVIVGIRKIVQTGINVPLWSCLIEVAPIANPPQHQQECARICTPVEGKPQPVIHYVVDTTGIGLGCLKRCVVDTHKRLGHKISKKSWEKINNWFKLTRSRRDPDDDGDTPVRAAHAKKPDRAKPAAESKVRQLFKKSTSSL